MPITRRECVVSGITTGLLTAAKPLIAAPNPMFKAIAFDAFPIFDPRPVFMLAEELFPGKGADLSNAWRNRQFEYTWLRSLSQRYEDFWQVTEDALIFAARSLQLDLTPPTRMRLMQAYLELKTWPDVAPALKLLKEAGISLAFLSNFTAAMLHANIKNAGLEGMFEHVLSTDAVQTYKPALRAYQMGIDTFKRKREEILFVAYAGWDAAGARWFGYPTFWMNRLHATAEELNGVPENMGASLADLVRFVRV